MNYEIFEPTCNFFKIFWVKTYLITYYYLLNMCIVFLSKFYNPIHNIFTFYILTDQYIGQWCFTVGFWRVCLSVCSEATGRNFGDILMKLGM